MVLNEWGEVQGSILNLEVKSCTYNGDESKFYFYREKFLCPEIVSGVAKMFLLLKIEVVS